MAEWAGIYKTGLATVSANGTTVTFQNAGNIAQAIRAGDRFGVHVGLPIRIIAMVGNVATLADPWPGPAQVNAAYEIMLTPYDSGYRQQLQVLLDRYGGAALGITWDNEDWTSGETYLSDTGLEHLGSTYRAIIEHTASAANEPGVGVNWQQAWRILAEKGDLSPEERAYLNATKATATGAASAAIGAAQDADQDRIATAADRVQTGQDRTQTGQDRTATGQDRAAIAGAAEATAADRVATGQDREKTTADAAATAADRIQTGEDRAKTTADATATAADRVKTGQDKTATAADLVKTGQDRAAIAGAQEATAADRAQTALDRIATGQDRTATNTAAGTAVGAAQAASEDATATAADRVQTGQDRTQTGQDRTATGQDKDATAADRVATGQDRTATGQDKAATAADRVQTGQDRLAAAASAQQAAETASAVNPEAVNTRFNAIEGLVGGKADQSALEALGSSQAGALALKAPLAGPVFTDIPRAPTPAAGNNSDQVATTAFVQALFNALVNGAPGFLDQFNEFAAAVGNDPNFATTILNALANKQPLDSDLTAIATLTTQAFGRALLTAADAAAVLSAIGLEQVNNTPDNLKPVSQAQQTALNLKLDARPALGAFAQTIADWNAARSNGWFMAADAANAPVGGWFLGFAEAHNDIYVTQTIHQFTADSATDSQTYRRSCNNGEWGAWAQLRITQGELDGRYAQTSQVGSIASRSMTISTAAPSGGADGDVWAVVS